MPQRRALAAMPEIGCTAGGTTVTTENTSTAGFVGLMLRLATAVGSVSLGPRGSR